MKSNNFSFIDSQNLNLGIQKLGWKLDYKKLRIYLAEKYNVRKAYMFIGFSPFNQPLENALVSDREKHPLLPTSVYGNKKVAGYEDAMRTILPETIVNKTLELL